MPSVSPPERSTVPTDPDGPLRNHPRHDVADRGRTSRHRVRRVLTVVLVAVLALAALSGCARVRAGLAVQPNDTVDGELTIATPDGGPDGKGPQLTIPPELEDELDVTPYDEDGFVGSTVRFSGLTFEQLGKLNLLGGAAGGRAELQLRRVGGRIAVQGRADLTTVPVDKADFQLKMSFPGEVVETNGEPDGNTVAWNFTPGEVEQISASVASTDPNAPSTLGWTLFLGVLVAIAAGVAVVLAKRNRNPRVRV